MAWQEITASNNSVTILALIARANDYGILYFKSGIHTFNPSTTRTSLTLHKKLKLIFEPGAIFLINSGFQLAIEATIEAGFNQIFDVRGALHVSGIQNQTFYPVWWGTANLDKMMSSIKINPPAKINFLNYIYNISKTLEIIPGINYTGNNAIFEKIPLFSGPIFKLVNASLAPKNIPTNINNLQFVSNNGYALSLENKDNNVIVENCYLYTNEVDPQASNNNGISISGSKLNIILSNLSFHSLSTSINLTTSYTTLQINQIKSTSCAKDIQSATVQSNLFISNSHFSGLIQGTLITSQIIITNTIGKISTLTTSQSKLIIGNSIFEGDSQNKIVLSSNNAMVRNCQWTGLLQLKSTGLISFADCQFVAENESSNLEISGTSPGILKIQGGFIKGKGIVCKSGELYFTDITYQTIPICTFLTVTQKSSPADQNLKIVISGATFKLTSSENHFTYLNISDMNLSYPVQIIHQNTIIQKDFLSADIVDDPSKIHFYQFLGQRTLYGGIPFQSGLINDLFYSTSGKYFRCTSSGSSVAWQEFRYVQN